MSFITITITKTKKHFNMKKIMIALSLMITLTASAFSGEERVDQQVLNAFKKEFTTAKDVAWEAGENFYQASFEYEGERVFAFYNTKAELLAISRHILSTELPQFLQKKVKKNYAEYWIAD